MTLKQIIDRASAGYGDDNILAKMCTAEGEEAPGAAAYGDTLALFLVRELKDTFDLDASDKDQVLAARRAVDMANDQLNDVFMALDLEEQS